MVLFLFSQKIGFNFSYKLSPLQDFLPEIFNQVAKKH